MMYHSLNHSECHCSAGSLYTIRTHTHTRRPTYEHRRTTRPQSVAKIITGTTHLREYYRLATRSRLSDITGGITRRDGGVNAFRTVQRVKVKDTFCAISP